MRAKLLLAAAIFVISANSYFLPHNFLSRVPRIVIQKNVNPVFSRKKPRYKEPSYQSGAAQVPVKPSYQPPQQPYNEDQPSTVSHNNQNTQLNRPYTPQDRPQSNRPIMLPYVPPPVHTSYSPPTSLQASYSPPTDLKASYSPPTGLKASYSPPTSLKASYSPPSSLKASYSPQIKIETSYSHLPAILHTSPQTTVKNSFSPPTTLHTSYSLPTILKTSYSPPKALHAAYSPTTISTPLSSSSQPSKYRTHQEEENSQQMLQMLTNMNLLLSQYMDSTKSQDTHIPLPRTPPSNDPETSLQPVQQALSPYKQPDFIFASPVYQEPTKQQNFKFQQSLRPLQHPPKTSPPHSKPQSQSFQKPSHQKLSVNFQQFQQNVQPPQHQPSHLQPSQPPYQRPSSVPDNSFTPLHPSPEFLGMTDQPASLHLHQTHSQEQEAEVLFSGIFSSLQEASQRLSLIPEPQPSVGTEPLLQDTISSSFTQPNEPTLRTPKTTIKPEFKPTVRPKQKQNTPPPSQWTKPSFQDLLSSSFTQPAQSIPRLPETTIQPEVKSTVGPKQKERIAQPNVETETLFLESVSTTLIDTKKLKPKVTPNTPDRLPFFMEAVSNKTPQPGASEGDTEIYPPDIIQEDDETTSFILDQMVEALSAFSHADQDDFGPGGALEGRRRRRPSAEDVINLLTVMLEEEEEKFSVHDEGEDMEMSVDQFF